jgi:hypothetical protein
MDDEQEAEVRRTITLEEIRAPGGDYAFRNQSIYTRVQ